MFRVSLRNAAESLPPSVPIKIQIKYPTTKTNKCLVFEYFLLLLINLNINSCTSITNSTSSIFLKLLTNQVVLARKSKVRKPVLKNNPSMVETGLHLFHSRML